MATIKNIIQTIFQSQGSTSTITQLNNLGRAQTRLGQSSASAGRAFSSQAAGLGGLVAAYAGAAATTFALQQAFSKLADSARAAQTLDGLTSLAATSGANASKLLQSVQEATKGQLTIVQAASQANLALSAGFNVDQIERLAGVATKASRALGRDLTDAMTRVVRGSAKMETELLDELGIYTKIEPATRAYAAAIGKNVTQLSEFERRQAFVNAVITEGERKFSSINTIVPSSAEKIEAFGATILNIGTKFGIVLADFIAPFADFLANNTVAALSSVAIVFALVAAKGLSLLAGTFEALTVKTINLAISSENVARSMLKMQTTVLAANTAIKNINVSTLGLNTAQQAELVTLQASAATRALTSAEMVKASALINTNTVALTANRTAEQNNLTTARATLATSEAKRVAAWNLYASHKGNITILNAARVAQLQYNAVSRATTPIIASATAAIASYTAALTAGAAATTVITAATTGAAAKLAAFLGGTIKVLGGIVAGFAAIALKLFSFASIAAIVVGIFALITVGISKLLGKERQLESFITKLGSRLKTAIFGLDTKSTENVFLGVAANTLEQLEAVDSRLKELDTFTFKQKFLGAMIEVTLTKDDLVAQVQEQLSDLDNLNFIESFTTTGPIEALFAKGEYTDIGRNIGTLLGAGVVAGFGTATGGVGFALSAAIITAFAAVGSQIGSAIDSTMQSQADQIEKQLEGIDVSAISTKYAEELSVLSTEQQRYALLVINNLKESYNGAERFNAQARLALDTQAALTIEAIRQQEATEFFARAIEATGKQVPELVKNFNIMRNEVTGIGEVITSLQDIGSITITIIPEIFYENLDILLEDLEDIQSRIDDIRPGTLVGPASFFNFDNNTLSNVFDVTSTMYASEEQGYATLEKLFNLVLTDGASTQSIIAELGASSVEAERLISGAISSTGLSIGELRTLITGLDQDISGYLQNFSEYNIGIEGATIRAASNITDLQALISSGTITQESYAQGIAAVSASLQEAKDLEREYQSELTKLSRETNSYSNVVYGLAKEILDNTYANIANIASLEAQLKIYTDLEEAILDYAAVLDFLKKNTTEPISPLDFSIAIAGASGSSTAALTATISMLTNFAAAAQTAQTDFDALSATLNALPAGTFTDIEIGEILSTSDTVANVQALALKYNELIEINDKLFFVTGNTLTAINLQTTKGIASLVVYEKAQAAIFAFAQQLEISATSELATLEQVTNELANRQAIAKNNLKLAYETLRISNMENQLARDTSAIENRINATERQLELTNSIFNTNNLLADAESERYNTQISNLETAQKLAESASNLEISRIRERQQEESTLLDISTQVLTNRLAYLKAQSDTQLLASAVDSGTPNIAESFSQAVVERQRLIVDAQAALSRSQLQLLTQDYNNRLELLAAEQAADIARLAAEADILNLRVAAADAEIASAKAAITNTQQNNTRRVYILEEEQRLENTSIAGELAILEAQKTAAANKAINDNRAIADSLNLEKDKAVAEARALIEQYSLLERQSKVFDKFITDYTILLNEAARQQGQFGPGISVVQGEQDFLAEKNALEARIDEITRYYARITVLELVAAGQQAIAAQAALDLEIATLTQRAEANDQFFAAELAAERDAGLARLRIANEAVDASKAARAELEADAAAILNQLIELESASAGAINQYFSEVNSKMLQTSAELISMVEEINVSLRTIENEEVLLELRFNLDKSNLESELEEIAQRSAIRIAEAQIGLLEALEANDKISPVEATDRIIEEQRKILAAEVELEDLRYARELAAIDSNLAILKAEGDQGKVQIEAQRAVSLADIQAKQAYLTAQNNIYAATTTALGSINQELVSGFTEVSNGLLQGLAKIFTGAAKAISTALGDAGGAVVGISASSIATPTLSTDAIDAFSEISNGLTAALETSTTAVNTYADAQITAIENQYSRAEELANLNRAVIEEDYAATVAVRDLRAQTAAEQEETARREAREGDGGGGGEEAQKKLDELNKKFNDAVKTMVESIKDVFIQVITLISDTITTISQTKIEGLIAQEEMLTSILENTSDRLGDVQSELSDSLDKELELREKILEQTEALVEAQDTYVKSIGLQNASIVDSSALYIEKLVEQKQSILDLAVAGRKSIALKEQEASLIDTQAQQEAALESATQARLKAEEQLALTQELLSFGTDLLSGQFTSLATAMMTAGQSINAVLQMLGMASGAGVSLTMDSISGALSGTSNALREFSTTLGEYLEKGGGTAAGGAQNALSAEATNTLTGINSALNVIGGAATGMQIGSVISGLVGDSGWATTIGGTIGGALATVFMGEIVSFIGSTALGASITASFAAAGMSGALTAAFAVAIPVIGAVVGALIGSLFKKTPKASASGTITAEGVSDSQYSASGGASSEGARSLGSIAENTLGGIISSLEQAGIMFTSAIDYTIKTVRSSITAASLQMEDGKLYTARDLGSGQAGAVAAEAFFIESFYKGLRVGDLIVQQLIPGAQDIQTAIDYFALLRNEAEKTQERFEESINFAITFRDTLRELDGPGFSTDELFTLITDSAKANAISLAAFYADLTNQTIAAFGSNSSQFLDLQSSIRTSLLSQIGLAEQIVDGTSQLIPISQALEGIDSGAVLVRSIIEEVTALTAVFEEQATALAGINIKDAIAFGINTQLREAVVGIGESISDGIELLRDPAAAAVQGLESIILNGIERLKVTTGIFNELEASLAAGVAISYDIMAAAEEAMNNAPVLTDLEIDAYLRSLTEAQLEAVIAAGMLENAILDLVEAQLAALEAIGGQRAVKSLIALSKGFKDLIGDITSSFAGISFQDLIGIGPDALSIADSLGQEGIVDNFVLSISSLLNNLASGVNVVENFTDVNNLLVEAYDTGTLSAEELAAGLTMSIDATQEFLSTLDSLADLYEDVISQIADNIDDARSGVTSALENLRDIIVGSFEDLIDATVTIFSIFDDTLSGIDTAGNELFDLQDRARDSLDKTSSAVRAFEEENALTGRTSAEVAAELATVKSRLALLMSQPVDLSKFMEITQLTSQQRALGIEISTLSKVESEYEELLASRTGAAEDLAFVESTILSLNDQLIDTRRKESEIIQATQDAAAEFIKKQEELLTITEMLAAANFNLNQARVDEQSAIVKLQEAITKYNTSMSTLEENMAGILDSGFLSATIEAALANARNLYYTLSESELAPILAEVTANTEAAANQLINLAETLSTISLEQSTGIITTNISTQINDISTAVGSIDGVFAPLLALFSEPTTTAVTAFRTSLDTLATTLITVNNTAGLNAIIRDYTTTVANSQTPIANLIRDYGTLRSTIDGLIGTDGRINSVRSAISVIGSDLLAAWNALRVNINTAAGKLVVTSTIAAGQTVGLAEKDSNSLTKVANYSNKYPKIEGATYSGSAGSISLADGGMVRGPGTSTSDSVSANLSNGEYVLRASSTKALGLDVLNMLNQTGSLNKTLSAQGRNGDSMIAHITPAEALALKRAGGSGTKNPTTGLMEFFAKDAGVVGKMFQDKEVAHLMNAYKKLNVGGIRNSYNKNAPSQNRPITITSNASGSTAVKEDSNSRLFSDSNLGLLTQSIGQTYGLINDTLKARGLTQAKSLRSGYATDTYNNNKLTSGNFLEVSSSASAFNQYPDVGTFPGQGYGNIFDRAKEKAVKSGGWSARPNQLMNMLAKNILKLPINEASRNSAPTAASVTDYVKSLNTKHGNFGDLYMLKNGGLVDDIGAMSTARDRINAMLEPGEFVLRKAAVDRMGVDNAIRLNSTGNIDNDVSVEVNVINNSSPVTPTIQQTRRENGKIVVDVILEDIRNNGPIRQSLRGVK